MTQSLLGAVEALQDVARGLAGINQAPDTVAEAISAMPFAASYPESGEGHLMMGWTKGLHVIVTEIHCAQGLLPAAIAQSVPYFELFLDAIFADPKLGGAVDTVVSDENSPISYQYGRMQWGGVDTIGFKIRTTVKIQ